MIFIWISFVSCGLYSSLYLADRMFPSARGSLTIVGFFATLVLYLVRINMSIAIVCMTIDEVETEVNATNTTSEPLGLTHARWSDKYMWLMSPVPFAVQDDPALAAQVQVQVRLLGKLSTTVAPKLFIGPALLATMV